MDLKEAIEATKIVRDSLKDFPNSYEILDTLLKGAEELQKENELARKSLIENSNIADERNDLLVEVQQLRKENEKLKEIDLTTVHIKGVCDEKERWRNKIKEKIEELNKKIDSAIDNSKGGLDEEFIDKGTELLAQKRILEELLKGV